eukprot:4520913-Alexandrium_andersonii.AAC.1
MDDAHAARAARDWAGPPVARGYEGPGRPRRVRRSIPESGRRAAYGGSGGRIKPQPQRVRAHGLGARRTRAKRRNGTMAGNDKHQSGLR